MNAFARMRGPAHGVQMARDSLGVPAREAAMVRNPRTLMMCSLLALATGLALGSQMAPSATDAMPSPALVPALAQRLQAWVRPETGMAAPAIDPIQSAADDGTTRDPTLEGARQPRGPRMSREGSVRAPR
jgi:hypothetical protein